MNTQIKKILAQLLYHEERLRKLEGVKTSESTGANKNNVDPKNIALAIINKVGNCSESESIQTKVLDLKNVGPKVLLSFYIAYKYFDKAWLTSGDVERVTSELGIKITTGNASNKIKEMRAYLESGAVRRKGAPTPYRLNRNGANYFEGIINEN